MINTQKEKIGDHVVMQAKWAPNRS